MSHSIVHTQAILILCEPMPILPSDSPRHSSRLLTVALGATLFAASGCGAPDSISSSAGPNLPFPEDPTIWPAIRAERIATLLGPAMDRANVDAWVVLGRENANDPIAAHVGAENAGGLAGFLFFSDEAGGIESLAISPETEAIALAEVTPLDSVRSIPRGSSLYSAIAEELRARNSQRIAINSSTRNIADGLSWTQRNALVEALGPQLSSRLASSEDVVIEWLSVKLPQEIDIMRRAAALTEQLELEAYNTVVPGVTTDADVGRFLKRRMAELGVADGWAPDQNPNVNSGPDRGHSHATEKVIQPGDIIQTDFGIGVHGMWVTDIQRFAYVLQPGETEAPPEMQARWEYARKAVERRRVLCARESPDGPSIWLSARCLRSTARFRSSGAPATRSAIGRTTSAPGSVAQRGGQRLQEMPHASSCPVIPSPSMASSAGREKTARPRRFLSKRWSS